MSQSNFPAFALLPIRQGKKIDEATLAARLNRLLKNPESQAEIAKNIPQGLKAALNLIVLMARLKSCPFKVSNFSAACEVVPF